MEDPLEITNFVLIHLQTWLPQTIPVLDSIRNKNCLWQPCLLMDRDEMSNHYRGPPIDASYKVSVHLATQFQRRRFYSNLNIDISKNTVGYELNYR
jgi:hypothetical protein